MPVEEMIWSKAFLMERERFDGADVPHLMRARQQRSNWPRLLPRFGEHWRVLLAHLVLFPYVYPHDPATAAGDRRAAEGARSETTADEGCACAAGRCSPARSISWISSGGITRMRARCPSAR